MKEILNVLDRGESDRVTKEEGPYDQPPHYMIVGEEDSFLGGRYSKEDLIKLLKKRYPKWNKKDLEEAADYLKVASQIKNEKRLRIKSASLKKYGFEKVSDNELVCKATQDFWSVEKVDGDDVIVRKVDGVQKEER